MNGPAVHKAVFLDRDGTINVEKDYVHKIEEFEFIDGAKDAVRRLNEAEFKVVVLTNQSGIARGYYSREDVEILHRFIQQELTKEKAHIDAFFYCPHLPEGAMAEYAVECECRKPKPGMVLDAQNALGIRLEESYIIGDSLSDMLLATTVPLKPILVRTGHGKETEARLTGEGLSLHGIADDLAGAVDIIIRGY
ncbi:MAG: D-glycero-beta-D-manno-heptose 1,7-bisphosphate 7-phosphatase [Bacteroidetes bacterium]|nr:D-glycero-beta-D-manno-heptose 1,7-bisphosphate 7-phosphatase [Bacteroidota bacterium]